MLETIARRTKAVLPLVPVEPMRIEVIGEDESSNAQARTYAEYRVFAALARHTPRVRGARVVLRRDERDGTCDTVVCAVTVALAALRYPSALVHAAGTRMRRSTVL